jgi:hypothetical protein
MYPGTATTLKTRAKDTEILMNLVGGEWKSRKKERGVAEVAPHPKIRYRIRARNAPIRVATVSSWEQETKCVIECIVKCRVPD